MQGWAPGAFLSTGFISALREDPNPHFRVNFLFQQQKKKKRKPVQKVPKFLALFQKTPNYF